MIIFYEKSSVFCGVLAPYTDAGTIWFIAGTFSINIASAIVYFITWIGLRSHAESTMMKRIIKSLFIMVTVDLSGWFLTPGLILLLKILDLEYQQFFAFGYFSAMFIHVALSIKLFIYYSSSSEYRIAITAFLFKISPSLRKTRVTVSRVSTIG